LSVNSYELILGYFNNEKRLLSFAVTTTFQGALRTRSSRYLPAQVTPREW